MLLVQVKIPDTGIPRFRHSATVFNASPGLTEVTLFGGSIAKTSTAGTHVLRFGESSMSMCTLVLVYYYCIWDVLTP